MGVYIKSCVEPGCTVVGISSLLKDGTDAIAGPLYRKVGMCYCAQ